MTIQARKRNIVVALAALVLLATAAAGWYSTAATAAEPSRATTASADFTRTDADIKVFKTATCGCCKSWVAHLRANGFTVEAVNVDQARLNDIKQTAGLTRELASCHTAFIDGYVIEGHVPAADIRRLVDTRPDVRGLSTPGMPIGAPGMEMGDQQEPYDVLVFDKAGNARVFASHPQ